MWHIVWSFRGILQICGFVDETRKIKQKTGGFAKHYRPYIRRYDYKCSGTCGNIVVQNSEVLDFSALAIGTAFSLSVTARLFSVKNIIAEKQVIDDIGGKK